jgi:hypothetical protein
MIRSIYAGDFRRKAINIIFDVVADIAFIIIDTERAPHYLMEELITLMTYIHATILPPGHFFLIFRANT